MTETQIFHEIFYTSMLMYLQLNDLFFTSFMFNTYFEYYFRNKYSIKK